MKHLLIAITTLVCFVSFKSDRNKNKLPETWNKDFSIKLYHGGGMLYQSTNLFLSKDSCVYNYMLKGKEDIKRFMLSDQEFEAVLKKMDSLNVGEIRAEEVMGVIHDKASSSICFIDKSNSTFCIGDGASSQLKGENLDRFSAAYDYLLALPEKKKNIKKK
jgi:hypothetical protein